MKATKTEQIEAIATLKKLLKPGSTVYTILRRVSASGTTRQIELCLVNKGRIERISYTAAQAMGCNVHKDGGITAQGYGMDMGFHLVYNLGRTLFPKGFKVKGVGRNGDTSGHDNDGGYALRQQWL